MAKIIMKYIQLREGRRCRNIGGRIMLVPPKKRTWNNMMLPESSSSGAAAEEVLPSLSLVPADVVAVGNKKMKQDGCGGEGLAESTARRLEIAHSLGGGPFFGYCMIDRWMDDFILY
ncbi:unnamed protein product [Cuscuta epithymum]|uniref:Uncharacterized protein n=1 Tax=Cuscuta epithymum TaxID=186058 RepID=A0AAV0D986_9ASTE|nr:unnamed protein product [Cuscuta epithymum]